MSRSQFIELKAYLLKHLGLLYSEKQEKDLGAKISAAAKGFAFDSSERFVGWLLKQQLDAEQTKKLASFLTIGETYFFRERKALEYLEHKHLPHLISKRRNKNQTLKIWSAGCSSGEEPYTIAILLSRLLPGFKNWNIKIVGTDINSKFLEKAKAGIYSKWSFRGIPESFKSKYFDSIDDNRYKIKPYIREMVDFSYLNLATPPYFPSKNRKNSFDVVLCRNVLIYFSHDGIKMVTQNLYDNLNDGGVLLLSPVETSTLIHPDFERLPHDGITVYKKDQGKKSVKPGKQLTFKTPVKLNKALQIEARSANKPKLKEVAELNGLQKLYNSGRIEEVEELTQRLIDNGNSKHPGYLLLLARIKANKGLLQEAERLCNKAIGFEKVNTEAHYLLANVYNEQGKTRDAITSINKTLFLDPDFSMAHFLLGNIANNTLDGLKHYNNALKSLSKLNNEDLVAGSDGLTAGRLSEMIKSIRDLQINR